MFEQKRAYWRSLDNAAQETVNNSKALLYMVIFYSQCKESVKCILYSVHLHLNALNDREKQVIRLRYGLEDGKPHTLEEIGEELKVTRERVRQIESRAMEKLRSKAER